MPTQFDQFENRMRKFAYASVLRQLSSHIHEAQKQDSARVQAPWVAERLVLWVLRDEVLAYGDKPMQATDLNKVLNMAWSGMDSEFQWFSPDNPLRLSLRAMLLAQLPHQRGQEIGPFGRQIDLLNQLDKYSRLYQLLESTLQMPPKDYLAMAGLFRVNAGQDISRVFSAKYRGELVRIFGQETVTRFFQTLLVPREATAMQMSEPHPDEWFQPNLLYRSPFTTYNGQWFFWGRCGLDRHLEFALSDIVGASADAQARRTFEDMFEVYVGSSLASTRAEVLDENAVRRRFNVEGGCCDYAIVEDNAITLLEVKNKALAHTFPASASVRTYKSKLKSTIVKAAEQLRNTGRFVEKSLLFASIHRVTVTYGDLYVAEADHLFDERSHERKAEHPVYILSVDHLDKLAEAVRLGQCTFASFFADYSARQQDPVSRLFTPAQLLELEPYQLQQQPARLVETYMPFCDELTERFSGRAETC
ncbi:hypothetical protein [Caballeronia sp. GAWG1-1]|uniref:hypothetical protein n=1 Tax=Caballeronia sp. GAWG1-1 TaxID=2921742 RepID=UPI002028389D|nr:hypothetical protein [Caballeronia sp. GAWG1-1]